MTTLLNEKNKKLLEKQAESLSDKDIQQVKQKLPEEFRQIEKLLSEHPENKTLKSVLKIGGLFYNIINNEDFAHENASRKWMGFALHYLISPLDLIPDTIGTFGYFDDNLVLQWVQNMVSDEIDRYNSFCLARQHVHEGELLEEVVKGSKQVFILIPGLLTRKEAEDMQVSYTRLIRNMYPDSGLYIFRWVQREFSELQMVSQALNHEIQLKTSYDYDKLLLNWQDAKVHTHLYAKALKRCIDNHPDLEGKSINLAGHSKGCQLIANFLEKQTKNIDHVIFLAAATTDRARIFESQTHFKHLVNVYSTRDNVLKFIFEKLSTDHRPLGLSPLSEMPTEKFTDMDVSTFIGKHSDYTSKLCEILFKVKELV